MSARRAVDACLVLAACVWSSLALGDVVLVGPQFEASSVGLFGDVVPAVAAYPQGGFVIAWSENIERPGSTTLRAELMVRRFDSAGAPLGSEFVVNTFTTGSQGFPVVDAWSGGFVIAWESDPMDRQHPQFGAVRRYDTVGVPLDEEIHFSEVANDPVIAADATGGFILAWREYNNVERRDYTLVRRFDSAANPTAIVDIADDGSAVSYTDVAMLADDTSVVVYADRGLRGRRFDVQGQPLGPSFTISAEAAGAAEAVADEQGGLVVVWAKAGNSVVARRFTAVGKPAAAECPIAQLGTSGRFNSGFPGVHPIASSAQGDLLVVWTFRTDSESGIAAQHVDNAGRPVGPAATIAATGVGQYLYPSVASDSDGQFIVAWNDYSGFNMTVRAQRLRIDPPSNQIPPPVADCPGDCDSNGQVDSAEIARLVRSLFDGQDLCRCAALDADGDYRSAAADLIAAVNAAASDCSGSNQLLP